MCVYVCVGGGLKQMQRGDTLQVNLIDSPVLGGDMAETTEGAKPRMSPCTLYVCVKRGTLCDTKSCRDVCYVCVSSSVLHVRSSKACPLVTGPACWVTDSPGREGTPGCLADN